MKKISVALAVALSLVAGSGAAFADCKERVRELREEINDERGDYTLAARTKAKRHLAAAELIFMNPVKCRKSLREARRALRKGENQGAHASIMIDIERTDFTIAARPGRADSCMNRSPPEQEDSHYEAQPCRLRRAM